MRDLKRMRERFLQDEGPVRLGNLASNLLRLSQWVLMGEKEERIVELMREIAWMMEWCGDLGNPDLVDMQREICRMRRRWPMEKGKNLSLAFHARQMSDRLLELSGLLYSHR